MNLALTRHPSQVMQSIRDLVEYIRKRARVGYVILDHNYGTEFYFVQCEQKYLRRKNDITKFFRF